jgi:tetrahedral aminopeptidase
MPSIRDRDTTEWLRAFSQLPGIPGHEAPIAAEVAKAFGAYADRVDRDPSGNVRGWILGNRAVPAPPKTRRPRAILTAHMDKIGFLVKAIEPGGFLRLTEVGGFDPRTLLGREVWIHSKTPLAGLFATKPPHLQKKGEAERVLPLDELYLDTGRPEREVRRRVPIGTPVTLRRTPVNLLGNRLAAPAMDDRSGIVVLLLTLEILSRSRPEWDVIAVATVEEEFGVYCLGARTASESLDPQLGIAIDVTHGDMPGAREGETYALGSGPSLCVGPNVHPRVLEGLRASARAIGIPYSVEGIPVSSGTDAMDIQIAREGIPTGVVGAPCRYMHTGVETLDPRDIERIARLLGHYLASLPLDWSVVEVIK